MTTITDLSTDTMAEMIGTEATTAEAYAMMAILSRECVVDTDDVSEKDWTAYLEEAFVTAALETDE